MDWHSLAFLYPPRFLKIGATFLGLLTCASAVLLLPIADQPLFQRPPRQPRTGTSPILALPPLHLDPSSQGEAPKWNFLEKDLQVFLAPKRPGNTKNSLIQLQLRSGATAWVHAPESVGLGFDDQGVLSFRESCDAFWLHIVPEAEDIFTIEIGILKNSERAIPLRFSKKAQALPPQRTEDLAAGTSLRILAEARSQGIDLVAQLDPAQKKNRQCLEIGGEVLTVAENEWLCWKQNCWKSIKDPEDAIEAPLAQICSITAQQIQWNVWDETGSSCSCLVTPLRDSFAPRARVEEFLSSLHVRSWKQITCTLDKQIFFLRQGDWVLRENGKWRLLRKPEERQKVTSGIQRGDLLLLDKIDFSQRTIKGRLFSAARTQFIPIEKCEEKKVSPRKTHAIPKQPEKSVLGLRQSLADRRS